MNFAAFPRPWLHARLTRLQRRGAASRALKCFFFRKFGVKNILIEFKIKKDSKKVFFAAGRARGRALAARRCCCVSGVRTPRADGLPPDLSRPPFASFTFYFSFYLKLLCLFASGEEVRGDFVEFRVSGQLARPPLET